MAKIVFNSEHKKVLDKLLLDMPDVIAGKMFGYPAYYVGNKLFACVYGDGVGIKVPEDVAKRLLGRKGIVPFQPMGKPPMRQWIQINRTSPEKYQADREIFLCAVKFVGSLKKK